jgi:hypothetical protein
MFFETPELPVVESWVEIIGAVGAVLTSLATLYLVHRRIVADRDTKWHRDEEAAVHEAVVKKLGVELAAARREVRRKS